MEIIPAIDLKDGRCVRLYQGAYEQETVFSDDPLDVALKWQGMGAPRLHLIDLDGAVHGEIRNFAIIRDIARAMLIPVQVGGGIRNLETIKKLLQSGVDRVILGTAAVDDPALVIAACRQYRESVVVSIDARNGVVATHGWVRDTDRSATALARTMKEIGVPRIIYTDINRDGTLTEPNFSAIAEMIDTARLPVIAAGGIASLHHLKMLKKLGAEGAIVGKALYTGNINLKQALGEINQLQDERSTRGKAEF
ncbi:MAG: 1-(5-phosphoribosyl)-5-[(5-phosphoribosylamino)methylideneamino]imidazole-4-carboxamide isomerase [Dehalococcoidales bacterium]|nr:1-(5-phosphoribosyl)-5-[(5-phosphoribosylamino)methylideneamino]imidazole-4-carboxamide isomerase [Dehalococcoidales bacterium]